MTWLYYVKFEYEYIYFHILISTNLCNNHKMFFFINGTSVGPIDRNKTNQWNVIIILLSVLKSLCFKEDLRYKESIRLNNIILISIYVWLMSQIRMRRIDLKRMDSGSFLLRQMCRSCQWLHQSHFSSAGTWRPYWQQLDFKQRKRSSIIKEGDEEAQTI